LPSTQVECLDSLQRRQPRHRTRAGLKEIEPLRHAGGLALIDGDVLRVEAALLVQRLISVDAVANTKALRARSGGHDDARAVGAEHQRKLRATRRLPRSITNRFIPTADAGGVNLDHYLVRIGFRHRERVERDRRWRSEVIDRGRLHGCCWRHA
jgi:hypothetical protein